MTEIYLLMFLYPIIIIFSIIISRKLELVDIPNKRKIHSGIVVNTLGITLYTYFALVIYLTELSFELENIIAIGGFVTLIGFIDDRINLSPSVKLLYKSFPILYLMLNGYDLKDLGSYEFIGTINLGKFSILFTFLACLLLINSFNYIDGADGIALGISATALLYFIFLNKLELNNDNILFLILLYAIIVCIIFNFLSIQSRLKAFLGDAGSLFLGFFIALSIIYLFKKKDIHPSLLIWVCWYPIYDFIYVTLKRIYKKKLFTKPDKSHFHHKILNQSRNKHFLVFLKINFMNISIISIGYLTSTYFGNIYSLLLFIIMFLFFFYCRIKINFLK